LPRPRNRVELAEDPAYVHARKAVIDFLYTRQAHVEKAAACREPGHPPCAATGVRT
jgi:nitrate/nitrite transport system ATP-binding protein